MALPLRSSARLRGAVRVSPAVEDQASDVRYWILGRGLIEAVRLFLGMGLEGVCAPRSRVGSMILTTYY